MTRAPEGAGESTLGKPVRVSPSGLSEPAVPPKPDRLKPADRPTPRPARLQIGQLPRLWSTAVQFLGDVRAEMNRVSWPDRQTIIASTVVVVFVLTVTALYLAGWDYIFAGLFSYLFKR